MNGRARRDRIGSFTRYPVSFRESPSTLDYIATDKTIFKEIESFRVLHHLGISDHECLSASIKTNGFYAQEVQQINIQRVARFDHANKK